MSATTTVTLELPTHAFSNQRDPLQRSLIRHLLSEERITMDEALALLAATDQVWLVEKLISDAEKALSLAAQVTDAPLREFYWQQYLGLLGYLFHWHEHWSTYHSQLLSVLRTAVRRYPVQALTAERAKIMRRLTLRLQEDRLYREDVFSAEHALRDVGWDTMLDLSPIADQLFQSYAEELGRA